MLLPPGSRLQVVRGIGLIITCHAARRGGKLCPFGRPNKASGRRCGWRGRVGRILFGVLALRRQRDLAYGSEIFGWVLSLDAGIEISAGMCSSQLRISD